MKKPPRTATSTSPKTSSGYRPTPAGRSCKPRPTSPTIGTVVDDAMAAIESDNPALQGRAPQGLRPPRLGQDPASARSSTWCTNIKVGGAQARATDVLGQRLRVLPGAGSPWPRAARAASSTRPRSVVRLLVEMLQPYEGRVYDPCCGSSRHVRPVHPVHPGPRHRQRQRPPRTSIRWAAKQQPLSPSTARSPTTPPGAWPA